MHIEKLRQLKYLTVIDVYLDRGSQTHDSDQQGVRAIRKKEFISLLKDSPSSDRKYLRWKVVQRRLGTDRAYDVVENEELEVSRGTS